MASRLRLLSPIRWFIGVNSLLIVISLISNTENFEHWQVPKSFNVPRLSYYLFLSACLVFGVFISRSNYKKPQNVLEINLTKVKFAYKLLTSLTLTGYVLWIAIILSRGGGLDILYQAFSPISGTYSRLNQYVTGVAGVTSLTQFGPAAAALTGYLRAKGEPWIFKILIVWIPAFIRAVLNAERIAIIEVVIPFFIVWFLFVQSTRRPKLEMSLACGLVATYIAVAEYSRSWLSYYAIAYRGTFSNFLLDRIQGYYVTSLNNGFLLVDKYGPGPRTPFGTFDFFFRFPLIKDFFNNLSVSPLSPKGNSLLVYGPFSNPGFNNPNGLLIFVIDWGWVLAPLAAIILGLFVSHFFNKAYHGDFAALIYFATTFYGFLELPRYLLWTNSRSFLYLISYVILRNVFKDKYQDRHASKANLVWIHSSRVEGY